MLKIDGVNIPSPTSYSFTESDLVENSTRNAAGYASWDVVRYNVGKIDLTWENAGTGVKLHGYAMLFRSKKKFNVTFANTNTGQVETREFYSGDRANELVRYVSALKYWSSLSVPFVEV